MRHCASVLLASGALAVAAVAGSAATLPPHRAHGRTHASPNVAAGTWTITATRRSARELRVTMRLRARVRFATEIRFDYKTCRGTRTDPRCVDETADRVSRPFVVHPGLRTITLRVTVAYPRKVRTACVGGEAIDLNPPSGRFYLLGPGRFEQSTVCPR